MTNRPSPPFRDAQARAGGSPGRTAPASSTSTAPPAVPPFLTVQEIVDLTGGRLLHPSTQPVRGAAVDSRLVRPGQLFVALPGERTDGHRHLGDAARAGAAALLVTRTPEAAQLEGFGELGVVQVDDAVRGLGAIAAGWRTRFDPLVVGITGSIAKTSTKEAVATVLAGDRPTLRSEGNQNNEIGLPLTVLRIGPDDAAVVLEMGMYVGGEIRDLARIARPRIGVVTAVLGVHVSRIGTLDAVEAAKAELVEALPADGVAVLNVDDPRVRRMADRTLARTLGYGFAGDAEVGAEEVVSAGLGGMQFTLRLPSRARGEPPFRIAATIPTLGRLSVHNALAAAAVGITAGMAPAAIVEALARGWSAPHRGEVVRAGAITIVDDTYNASPASMVAALELLGGLPGRRIAVLGEMLELGEESEAGHREVGRAAAARCAAVCVVGSGAAGIATGAGDAGMAPSRIVEATDLEAAADHLEAMLRPGDVVLIKASRGAQLERLVERLVTAFGDERA